MRFARALGLGIFLCSVGLVLAGGGIGIPKKEDVPKYLTQLKNSTVAADRAKAAEMLGKCGSISFKDVEGAIEPLQMALKKDKDGDVRAAAARALGNIQPEGDTTVPILIERLKNDDVMKVKLATAVALGQFGPEAKDAVPFLKELATKFDTKTKKKVPEVVMIQDAIRAITQTKKKKN